MMTFQLVNNSKNRVYFGPFDPVVRLKKSLNCWTLYNITSPFH